MPTNPDNKILANQSVLHTVLELACEGAGLLCYGIGGEADSILAMQRNFIGHLQNIVCRCSPSGARILLAGASVGLMRDALHETGLNPIPHPNWISDKDGEDSRGVMETGASDQKSFQSVVIEGSICYRDQLGLLSKVRQVLDHDGHLVLFGENLADDSAIRQSELANLSSLRQLSERLGFSEELYENHSDDAAMGLQKLIDYVVTQREQLLASTALNAASLQAFESELKLIAEEFASGRRCFGLFVFKKMADPPGEYAHAEYGDIHSFDPVEVKDLFEASFGVDFDLELWDWKYKLGKGTCVVAREASGGAIVSHYGGAPRKIDYFGQPSMAIQPCDVMVLPEVRRHYGKSSLFFKTAATFLEREIGNTVGHLLGFGFPNQKAMNIALRLGLYEKTDDFVEVVYQSDSDTTSELELDALNIDDPAQRAQVDKLWQIMRKDMSGGIIGVRDADYVRYRYFEHPFSRRGLYECHLLKEANGEVLAVAVLKEHGGQMLVMDVICSLEAMRPVLSKLNQSVSSRSEFNALKVWITRGWLGKVELPGCTVNDLGIEIPCNSWNPGPSSTTLYGAWWLLAGDMDFM